MQNTVRTVTRVYVVAVVWFFVMLTTALALSALTNDALLSLGAGPIVSTAATLAVAVLAGSMVAAVTWARLRSMASAPVAHDQGSGRSPQDETQRVSSAPTH
ncbi:MAG: hypothetical protein U9O18_03285 [Chloroflexota bacterium]|nr:hypothetical protein [Chloroflexota bacterium]